MSIISDFEEEMTVLVTGGAGFVGGHVAQRLLERGRDVVVLDRAPKDGEIRKRRAIDRCRAVADHGDGEYEYVRGDVRDAELVADLVDRVDAVSHQASLVGVRESVATPRAYDETNVDGTLNLLDAVRDSDVDRLVVASSSSVYGKPRDLPYEETHPTTPVSPYGASKLAAERYAGAYHEVYDVPAVALRYFTVYGPRMRPNMAISNFVSRCDRGESPVVYGDGTQTRDFTYVDDVVDATIAALYVGGIAGETINVGSGDRIAIRQLAEVIRDELAPDLAIEFESAKPADVEHTHADVTRARRLLDYDPIPIREGVERFVEWYHENRDWYEPVVRG
jgi:UDP-glucose 4-epimerase